eukprot:COSAG04_NODE_1513_length_6480_cov_12.776866_4_plen_148_part_00
MATRGRAFAGAGHGGQRDLDAQQRHIEERGRQIAEQQLVERQGPATLPLHPAIASVGAVQALDASPEQRRAINDTKEWDKVKHTQTDFKQADKDYWAAQSKKHGGLPLLIVCDDMNWQDLNPKERSNAYAMVSFVCTHFNATAILDS